MWEKGNHFAPNKKGKPYTILMPPPNANASLHAGHTMYSIEDILIRWKRMQGFAVSWRPGMDHAGFETQYVYEKHLKKNGKSRLDFDRKTLYKNIFGFVKKNSGVIYDQFKKLGFSADWDKSVFTLDPHVIERVFKTFKKMESEKLVYRDDYIVNYCTHCGTSLAELEVIHVERIDRLYYIKYPIHGESDKHITVATVRPETMLGDAAVAVNPKDKRYNNLLGKKLTLPLTTRVIPVIEDTMVDMEFGTGAVKITPAHDPNDFRVGKKNNYEALSVINLYGQVVLPDDATIQDVDGKRVKTARELIVKHLKKSNLIEKIDNKYKHSVTVCYKCKRDLEPTITPNWFVKVKTLKEPVIEVVKKEKVKFYPKRYKKQMLNWLEIMHDWPISRQVVWGIRIPAWYCAKDNPNLNITFLDMNKEIITGKVSELLDKHSFTEIEKGLQSLIAGKNAKYKIAKDKPGNDYLQETDTFDTWFSSAQWPLVVLSKKELKTRLPTDLMGTLSDILKFWISRMIIFSLYLENEIPFKDVYLWAMIADAKGVKMSKSKGNVINPIELVDKYGADALRMSIVFGVAPGGKVILSDDRVRGMRNFANKIWNMARFMLIMMAKYKKEVPFYSKKMASKLNKNDKEILKKLNELIKTVDVSLGRYRFADAAEAIYHYMWNDIADSYIEHIKNREDKDIALSVLRHIYLTSIKLLHPFMPFVTEAIWQEIPRKYNDPLIISKWPKKDF